MKVNCSRYWDSVFSAAEFNINQSLDRNSEDIWLWTRVQAQQEYVITYALSFRNSCRGQSDSDELMISVDPHWFYTKVTVWHWFVVGEEPGVEGRCSPAVQQGFRMYLP